MKKIVLLNESKIEKFDIIYTPLYAICTILDKSEDFAWLRYFIFGNPSLLNDIFLGATVDILQQKILKGEEYIYPFARFINPEVCEFLIIMFW